MQIARFPTLFLAIAIASPALYGAFVTHTMEVKTALIRLLIAVPVAAIMLAALAALTKGYGEAKQKQKSKLKSEQAIRAEAVTGEPIARRSSD